MTSLLLVVLCDNLGARGWRTRRASANAGAYYPYLVAPISAGIDFIRRERAERAGG